MSMYGGVKGRHTRGLQIEFILLVIMSYCKREGKDKSVFLTKEDAAVPEAVTDMVMDDQYGIILPNGEINWDCPCLGGMAYGTCGQEFKDAFSCFHYSEEEEKGIDCIPQFRSMQECFSKHPDEYGRFSEDQDDNEEGKEITKTPTSETKTDSGSNSSENKLEPPRSDSGSDSGSDSRTA